MKTLFLLAAFCCWVLLLRGQSTGEVIKQQAGEGVREGTAVATATTATNVSNKLVNKLFSKKAKNKADSAKGAAGTAAGAGVAGSGTAGSSAGSGAAGAGSAGAAAAGSGGAGSGSAGLKTYSKFDFVPGEKILVVEDFTQDALGDFPDKWNTNSTGEVQQIEGQEGKWFSVTKRGVFLPEFINSLPENFTLQFDMVCNETFGYGCGNFAVSFDVIPNPAKQFTTLGRGCPRNEAMVWFQPHSRATEGLTGFSLSSDDVQVMNNQATETDWVFSDAKKRVVKISFWRQRQRLRVYMNEEKVWDLPRAFETGKTYNSVLFLLQDDLLPNSRYLFSNIRLAVGAPDTRNKLITEGRFSTTGILFDVNSATVKPESYGTLKDIADVLKENAEVKVKIVGHTDSDGDAAQNLGLSKKRSAAVRDALVAMFGIDGSRIQTDGMGATQPVAPNTTPTGKAQNRRVEFIKQ